LGKKLIKRYLQPAVQRVWDIDGYPNYFFGEDKNLYRITARGELRRNPRHLKGYTLGYVLKSRFYSYAQLRPLLRRYVSPTDHPKAI
jgi:hypothetical protein